MVKVLKVQCIYKKSKSRPKKVDPKKSIQKSRSKKSIQKVFPKSWSKKVDTKKSIQKVDKKVDQKKSIKKSHFDQVRTHFAHLRH